MYQLFLKATQTTMYVRGEPPTALPLYVQISEVLIREIASGRLLDGVRLPPERELAKQHGTTVRTLRKALAILEKNGLIESIQGSGNYVRKTPDVASVYSMFRLELLRGGGLPTAKILTVDEMEKPGVVKVSPSKEDMTGNVRHFPSPIFKRPPADPVDTSSDD